MHIAQKMADMVDIMLALIATMNYHLHCELRELEVQIKSYQRPFIDKN